MFPLIKFREKDEFHYSMLPATTQRAQFPKNTRIRLRYRLSNFRQNSVNIFAIPNKKTITNIFI